MKKKLFLPIVQLVLIAVAALCGCTPDQSPLDPAHKGGVTWLRLISGVGDTVTMERQNGAWLLTRDHFPADTVRVNRVLNELSELQMGLVAKTKEPAVLAKFGLNAERSTLVEWAGKDGEISQVLVGTPKTPIFDTSAPDFGAAFWKVPGQRKVYRAANMTVGVLGAPVHEADWRSRVLTPSIIYNDVQSIETDWIDSTGELHHYRLERLSNTAVQMVEPMVTAVPRRNAAHVYVQTSQFIADDFVTQMDTAFTPIGLDSPQVVVKIGMKDGKIFTLTGGNIVGEYRYAWFPGHKPVVIKIYSWRFDFFRKTAEQLRDPAMLRPDTEDDIEDDIRDEKGFRDLH